MFTLQGLLSSDSVRVDSDGLVDPGDVQSAITDATCLVSIMHSNNEVGSVQPISDITHIARQRNVLVHTDAAQSIGKVLLLCLSQAAENAACVSAVTYSYIACRQYRRTVCCYMVLHNVTTNATNGDAKWQTMQCHRV